MTGVSQRAYARLRGVAMSAVQKAIASKRITPNPDGTIDPEWANQEWEPEHVRRQDAAPGAQPHSARAMRIKLAT